MITADRKAQIAEEFSAVIQDAHDAVGTGRFGCGTNDIVLTAFVDPDSYEIRATHREEVIQWAVDKLAYAPEGLLEWLRAERPPTVCPLVIFDQREPSSDTTPVYWVRLILEGTLGVLN